MAYTTIDNPSEHFNTVLYTGNGSARNITGVGFQPDWLWIKQRSGTTYHRLYDSTRGAGKEMYSNTSDAEADGSSDQMSAFISDGFSIPSSGGNYTNINTATYVAWQWAANGGTTSSNSDGDITSTVQANTTAGFSIVTWTGNATNPSTIGHGLNQKPDVVLLKNRDSSGTNWIMYHSANTSAPETDYLILDSTNATTDSANVWSDTEPTSSVFTVGSAGSVNNSGDDFITYCFHSVEGYSKFGSYTGNGNADGPFVYTGFKPALVIAKRTDGSGNDWRIADNKRDPFNIVDGRIKPNSSDAEDNADQFDFLSNGFKLRTTAGDLNGTSGHTFIYMAFAEHPFVSSKGVPVTAR